MSRTIFIALMVSLPVFLGNVSSSLAANRDAPILPNKFLPNTDLITSNIKELIHLVPFQLSARDDQTEDCLRAGDCKY
jgi:hydroxymethylpyrimidine/phosphomethylpyrimidine kinase